MPKIKEKDLLRIVQGCIDKQLSSQKELYYTLFDDVSFYVGRMNLTLEEEEDLVQEIFLKIFCNIESFDHRKSNVNTWSSVIANRTCLSYIRKKKIKFEQLDSLGREFAIEDRQTDFLMLKLIQDYIDLLPELSQQVFRLSVMQGLGHTEIASLVDISPNASRAYLSRAKSILRDQISAEKEIQRRI